MVRARLSCVSSAAETLAWHTFSRLSRVDGLEIDWDTINTTHQTLHSGQMNIEHALHATLLTLKALCLSSNYY